MAVTHQDTPKSYTLAGQDEKSGRHLTNYFGLRLGDGEAAPCDNLSGSSSDAAQQRDSGQVCGECSDVHSPK